MIMKLLALITAAALALGTMAVSVSAQAVEEECSGDRLVAPGSIYTGTKKPDDACEDEDEELTIITSPDID